MKADVDVLVIGGGVVGVCSAHYLAASGRSVRLVERGEINSGCSHGNGGLLVPSHSVPLAAPGVVRKALKWMFDSSSPFYIQPRLDWDLISWLWRFNRSCTRRHVRRAMPLLRDLSMASLDLFDELAGIVDFGLTRRGVLMLYKSEGALSEEVANAEAMAEIGIQVQVLGRGELADIEPELTLDALGGVYFPQDGHVTPMRFIPELAQYTTREQGVQIQTDTEVLAIEMSDGGIGRVVTTRGDVHPREVVLAAGAHSGVLGRQLGLKLPIQGAKGYSITFEPPSKMPSLPIVCAEAKVGVTPMIGGLRFAGTLELAGLDMSISRQRVKAVLDAVPTYLPELNPADMELAEIWRGLRPCTPDGLPFVGRSPAVRNLTVATGHAMIGVSLGPITGKLVSEIVAGVEPCVDIGLLKVDRF